MGGFQCVTLISIIRTHPDGYHMKSEVNHMWCLQSPGKMIMKAIKPTTFWSLHNRLEATRSKRVYDPIVERSRTGATYTTLEIEYYL